jgi:hypothetical protein
MQAPTTEGGIAGHDPQMHPCPACGADNADTATFCWKCYRAFEAPAARAAGWPQEPAHWPAAPTSPGPFAPAPRPKSRFGLLGAIVTVTLGVVATVAFVALRQPAPGLPDSFGGLQRVSSAQTDAASESFRALAESDGLRADMAFYGGAGEPAAAVMWVDAENTAGGTQEAFDMFVDGFAEGLGAGTVGTSQTTEVVGTVTYRCATVSSSVSAGACMWTDDDIVWVVMDVRPGDGLPEAQDLAVEAHDAVA